MTSEIEQRAPSHLFNLEIAQQKVRLAEDGWNCRDPQRIAQVYTVDSQCVIDLNSWQDEYKLSNF